MKKSFKVTGKELIDKVNELIKEGNVRRIIVKNQNDEVYMEIPLTFGVIGVLAAPIIAALSAIAGLIANFKIEVIKKDNQEAEFIEIISEDDSKSEEN